MADRCTSILVYGPGTRLRLVFADAALAAEFATRFGGVPTHGRRGPELKVFTRRVPATDSPPGTGAIALDGCGAYRAAWDRDEQRGWVQVTGRHSVEALANAVRRLMRHYVLPADALVLHAACVQKDGRAFVFAGRSGAGKTTVSGRIGGGTVLSDDMTVLRRRRNGYYAWGLPGPGTGVVAQGTARGIPLAAVFGLVKARSTGVSPLAPAVAAAMLIGSPVEARPGQTAEQSMEAVSDLVRRASCFALRFRKHDDVWAALVAAGVTGRRHRAPPTGRTRQTGQTGRNA